MNTKQVFYAALFVTFVQLASAQSALAQYYFERDPTSYVRVVDDMAAAVIGYDLWNTIPPYNSIPYLNDLDVDNSDTGEQSLIAALTSSVSTSSTVIGYVTASSNTQMTFNPDLVANGQVSALAINTAIAALDSGTYEGSLAILSSTGSNTRAICSAKFTLKNSQTNAPPTQVKLKIRQSTSLTDDPDFFWVPSHSFSIYKNGSSTASLTSSSDGEVTFIDPAAVHGDYYTITGTVSAEGGVSKSGPLQAHQMLLLGGSCEVTGEAEVSVVP
jgi:hypothetical protein